jgi:hypothetical protein
MIIMRTLNFRKSSRSNPSQNCVEVAYRTSSYSGGDNGSNCVEVGLTSTEAHLRDSKNPEGGTFSIPGESFTAFLKTL